ncbi:hypothetical protein ACF2JD_19515 [Aeromonas sp. A-5]|uniref:hypothetical protein n=1 Tax=Aeromonas ichthyocola TaxID=3367746 RepID=UPI0038D6F64E
MRQIPVGGDGQRALLVEAVKASQVVHIGYVGVQQATCCGVLVLPATPLSGQTPALALAPALSPLADSKRPGLLKGTSTRRAVRRST